MLRPYAALPSWLTQRAVPAAAALLPEPTWIPEDRNFIIGLKRLGQFSATSPKASLVRWGSYFTHGETDTSIKIYNMPLSGAAFNPGTTTSNSGQTSRFNLARVAVMRDMDNAAFARIIRGEGLAARRARAGLLNAAKAILGNSAYERVRARVLP